MQAEANTGDSHPEAWSFVVDRMLHVSFRPRPFLTGHVEHGVVRTGDWFRCPAGVLGQVASVEQIRILNEPEEQTALVVERGAISEGDLLVQCFDPPVNSV